MEYDSLGGVSLRILYFFFGGGAGVVMEVEGLLKKCLKRLRGFGNNLFVGSRNLFVGSMG